MGPAPAAPPPHAPSVRACSFLSPQARAELAKSPVDNFSAGLVDDSNFFEWDITIIGPADTILCAPCAADISGPLVPPPPCLHTQLSGHFRPLMRHGRSARYTSVHVVIVACDGAADGARAGVCSEGGFFKGILTFPQDYPNNPPEFRFTSEMWHPNGVPFFCWPAWHLKHVLVALFCLCTAGYCRPLADSC